MWTWRGLGALTLAVVAVSACSDESTTGRRNGPGTTTDGSGSAGAGAGGGPGGFDEVLPPIDPEIPEVTTVVSDEALASVVVEPTQLVFDAATAGDILTKGPGDILVGDRIEGVGSTNPFGFLRKVVSIREEGGVVIVETEQASLTEAIESGSSTLQARIGMPTRFDRDGDVQPVTLSGPSGKLLHPGLETLQTETGGALLGELDVGGKILGPAKGKVTARISQGSFNFNPDLELDVRIRWFSLERFKFRMSGDFSAAMALALAAESRVAAWKAGPDGKGVTLLEGEQLLPTIFIGPVPVVSTLEWKVGVGAEAGFVGKGSVEAGVSVSTFLQAGTIYENDTWTDLSESDFQLAPIGPNWDISAGVYARAYPKLELAVRLYDAAGPGLEFRLPQFTAEANGPTNCDWKLEGALRAILKTDVQIPVIDKRLAGVEFEIAELKRNLLEGEITSIPGCEEEMGGAGGGGSSAGGSSSGGVPGIGGFPSGGTTAAGGSSSGGTTSVGGSSSGGTTSAGGSSSGGTTSAGGSSSGGSPSGGGATSTGGVSGSGGEGGSGGADEQQTCGAMAEDNGWEDAYCEVDGNDACRGKGPATSDCDHCCSGFICRDLGVEKGWFGIACENAGNGACGGKGTPTSDCDACCGDSCITDDDCSAGVCAPNGTIKCCQEPAMSGELCATKNECQTGEECLWNGENFVCAAAACID